MPDELMTATVLIVEDDARQSDAMRTLLEESSPGTAVIVAKTLKDALAHDRAGVDAVLLDLGLPDSSGLETLTAMVGRFAPVPVIVLTGTADKETGERAIALGAEDYLEKAVIPPSAIRRVVRHAIRRFADRTAAAERDAQNKALGQLGQLALTSVSSATFLGTICEIVAHVLAANAMFVERSADGLRLARTTAGGATASWPPLSIHDESPLGEAIRANRAIRVDDIRNSGGSAAAAIFQPLDAVSVAVVPVRTTFSAPEGVLAVWRKELRAFNDQDVAFLSAVSNILASTMQRNASQEAHRLGREQLERILDAVPDRIFRLDHNLRVKYVNQAAARGLPLIELGMHVEELSVPAAHRARWRSGIQRTLVSGVAERFDMDAVSARRYDVSLVPLTHANAPSVIVVMRDVTERVREHAQRLESLGTLATGVTHDLNDILMSILMSCGVLKRGGAPPSAEQTVDRIANSARRGADIITQLRTFVRGHRADGEMTNPGRLVAELVRMLRETSPPSIAIESVVDPDLWSIACDRTQILQVLLNLGVNARDAMPDGGTLGIRARNVEIDAQYANVHPGASPGVYVMLSVSDTGAGRAQEEIERIFDPGSIVKGHGGFLNVHSEPGATVVEVYLPALFDTAAK